MSHLGPSYSSWHLAIGTAGGPGSPQPSADDAFTLNRRPTVGETLMPKHDASILSSQHATDPSHLCPQLGVCSQRIHPHRAPPRLQPFPLNHDRDKQQNPQSPSQSRVESVPAQSVPFSMRTSLLQPINPSAPLWRNWLARLTVNQEVGSSSLPGGDGFTFCLFHIPLRMFLVNSLFARK